MNRTDNPTPERPERPDLFRPAVVAATAALASLAVIAGTTHPQSQLDAGKWSTTQARGYGSGV